MHIESIEAIEDGALVLNVCPNAFGKTFLVTLKNGTLEIDGADSEIERRIECLFPSYQLIPAQDDDGDGDDAPGLSDYDRNPSFRSW